MSNIREVAKRAGVSTATVSRVLSRPDVVSPDTRVRVLKAVERLGYAPNSVAKNLRTLKSRKLLVTVPDIANPFFALILQGIEDAAQKNGYAVLVGDTQDDETREERYAQMLKQKEADGLIFLGHRLPRVAASVVQESSPLCAPIVNGCEFSAELGVPSVHIDNAKASAEAMQHLFELGHRAIGIVTGPLRSPLSRDRLAGARASARERGCEPDLIVMQGDFSIQSGAEAAGRAPATRTSANSDLLLQRRDGNGGHPLRAPPRAAHPRGLVGCRLRRHPLRAVSGAAADDHCPADAGDWRRYRQAPPRNPQRPPRDAGVGHAAAHPAGQVQYGCAAAQC